MREKYTYIEAVSAVKIEENKIISFDKRRIPNYSFRVLSEGCLGVHYHEGEMADEEGYARAAQNLALKRPYSFEQETGQRQRDRTEQVLTDRQLLDLAREALEHIHNNYPDFILSGSFEQRRSDSRQENDRGLDYSSRDCSIRVNISYKHRDSRELEDGWFSLERRTFEPQKLYDMADNYLGGYYTLQELPEEIIIQKQYYDLLDKLRESLDAERMCLGSSLLSGRIGEKVFSEDFDLIHDASAEECRHRNFWDGEGVTLENDKLPYIEKGVVLRGYADKRTAKKYGVKPTGSARISYGDIPKNGNVNFRIRRSEKTVKELLNGRLSVVPVNYAGGGFNEKGEYVMPVQMAYLCDGEKFLGRLPEFTLVSSMFTMFGEDFIGVGSDDPVFHDKQLLTRMHLGKRNQDN